MYPPAFWNQPDSLAARLLAPFAAIYARATARRVARPGWRAPVPVICCGNASAGGAGKTTLALDIGQRLRDRGHAVAFLTRGYRGRASGVVRVVTQTSFREVGDEALLLAALAPTYVCADRAASARVAIADGATVLVMDDGLQNPTLVPSLSLLVIDGAAGFGNGRVIPAGPLREPIAAAAARCQAAVLIGEDRTGIHVALPILRATLHSAFDPGAIPGPIFAFAGIGRPGKFFETLRAAGATVAGTAAFPDHHAYTASDIARLRAAASRLGAQPVTTPKDAVRLPPASPIQAIGVRLVWRDPAALDRLLDAALAR